MQSAWLNQSVSLNLPALILVLLLCVLLVLRLSRRRKAWHSANAVWPFYAKRALASPGQVLYHRLVSALPGHLILCGVDLPDVLGVRRGFDAAAWNKRIRHLRYDFVVCTADARVLAAIELDDPSRQVGGTRPDPVKERASAAAGMRLLHWQAKALPDQAQIQEAFGAPPLPFFESPAASANQSWWPPVAGTGRNPPRP